MHESPSRERLRSARAVQFVPTFEAWCGVDGPGIDARMQRPDELGIGGMLVDVGYVPYLQNEHPWCTLCDGLTYRELTASGTAAFPLGLHPYQGLLFMPGAPDHYGSSHPFAGKDLS